MKEFERHQQWQNENKQFLEEEDGQQSQQTSTENIWVKLNGKWRYLKKNLDPCWRYTSQGWRYFPGGETECQKE